MKLPLNQYLNLSFTTLLFAIISQEGYAWELEYTVAPIALVAIMMIIRLIILRPKVHNEALLKGGIALFFAVHCFAKGLNEN